METATWEFSRLELNYLDRGVLEYLAFNPNPTHIREGVVSHSWVPHAVSAGWWQRKAHSMHDTHAC
jgi:hypothetical protein